MGKAPPFLSHPFGAERTNLKCEASRTGGLRRWFDCRNTGVNTRVYYLAGISAERLSETFTNALAFM